MKRLLAALMVIAAGTPGSTLAADEPHFELSWPGSTPERVAEGIINTDALEINLVFNRDYTELYFARVVDGEFRIFRSDNLNGRWTSPRPLALYPEGFQGEAVDMALSPDDQSLYFLGITQDGANIWVSNRSGDGWSLAQKLDSSVNTQNAEFYPVAVADGSLYYVSDRPGEPSPQTLYKSTLKSDGRFAPGIPVGPPVDNEKSKGDTYVAADESYIILSSDDRDGFGSSDLYISFSTPDGGWSEPRNMGPEINGPAREFCPMVSFDGKWLMFSRRYGDTWPTTTKAEIYWMDASIIEKLRQN